MQINKSGYLYDFIILKTKENVNHIKLIELGDFNNCIEGSEVYTCGYAFGQNSAIYSQGIISNKSTDTLLYYSDSLIRNVALLDITLNRGNSGGAVILKGKSPKFDKIIGFADFIVIPANTETLTALKKYINPHDMGNFYSENFDFQKFAKSVVEAIENTSYGIGGIISINEIKKRLKNNSSQHLAE